MDRSGASRKTSSKKLETGETGGVDETRRRKMKHLYTALSSLLPQSQSQSQSPSGKRSCLSDTLDEAAEYIECLQRQILDLEKNFDNARNLCCCSSNHSVENEKQKNNGEFPSVKVRKIGPDTVEMVVDGTQPDVKLSSLLDCVESFSSAVVTVSRISATLADFTSIAFKVSDMDNFDAGHLACRIKDIVQSYPRVDLP